MAPLSSNEPGVSERLRAILPALPEVQRGIAELVLEDPAAASRSTIVELADACAVSTGSITRLCRALGLSGYSELRLGLASDSGRSYQDSLAATIGTDVSAEDDLAQIATVVSANVGHAVTESVTKLNLTDIDTAAGRLASARRVQIFGTGGSGVMANDFQQRAYRIGVPCWTWADTHLALSAAALLGNRDVLLAISHSGHTRDVYDVLTEAGDKGAFTIAVTDDAQSPIGTQARLVLTSSVGDLGYHTEAIAARHAQLVVLDVLYVAVAQRTQQQTRAAITATAAAVSGYKRPGRVR
ncbi:MurR/RpiR family transcriptional regulator [Sciscionella marina]|uniref:MurR/RpiR family transcriptional regulator n=1 Tax=Sciscionella marina TaxID=508770 RepID=UPI00035FE1B7|nr:MurR/RpiR family transcriptional regulator [Sciscionella marina]